MVMTKKNTATHEERYPVIEEGGGAVPSRPEERRPLVKPEAKILKGVKDKHHERMVTYEQRYMQMLTEVALQLIEENHPLAGKLGTATRELLLMHNARNERIEIENYPQRVNAGKQRIQTSKEVLEADKAAWIAKHKTVRGWQSYALIHYGIKDPRSLKRIME